MFKRIKHVHFVGIGGIGMSGIAEVLLNLGYKVTGSDLRSTDITERLEHLGAAVYPRHAAENVTGANVVVISSAVHSDNPEIEEAKRRKIPVIARAEMLAELARLKYAVTVAGTHGKTTTTSMIATVLDRAGYDPTVVVGGLLNTIGSNARLGKGEFIVLEADESDRSFLLLSPTIAVVTNIEADHLDHYRDLEDIEATFLSFINKVPFYGAAILCIDEPSVQSLIPKIKRPMVTYGTAATADVCITDVRLEGLGSTFTVRYDTRSTQKLKLNVPGMHNVLNATAAFAVARNMDLDSNVIANALENFRGVDRRFQIKSRDGVTIIDDYAHHPTEIRATLSAAKTGNFNRIFAVFQPHRYTRTFHFFDDFARAFNLADMVFVLDIYPAGENPIEGINTPALIEKLKSFGHKNAIYAPTFEMIESQIIANAKPGDAVVVMGAGSVTKLSDMLSQRFFEDGMKIKAGRLIRSGQIIAAVAVLAVLFWATYETVVYFRTAPRFEVKQLSVLGLKRVRQNQVLAKAGFAVGTNVFCINLDEMRERVEELEWVRYAAVQRVLPDEIVIKIAERDPIGLTRIRGETYLFDIDGKILDPATASGSSFPILDTLRLNDRAGNLRKVQTYSKVMDEVGETSLSEVHINDAGEVTIVSASDPVSINLGITDFHNRWIRYLQLKPHIQQRYPQALRVDLRFKNQVIIKMKDDDPGEKIVWGTKKDTL